MARAAVPRICVLLLVGVLVAGVATAKRPRWHQLTPQYSYDQYLTDFDKTRVRAAESPALRSQRGEAFDAELASVLAHNSDSSATFRRGLNQFSDWTAEEKRGMLMLGGSGLAERLLTRATTSSSLSKPADGKKSRLNRPGFDWRRQQPTILTTVKDQGGCGSCWAHATTEVVESAIALKYQRLFTLSQQQLVSCVPPLTTHIDVDGTNVTDTMHGCDGYFPNLALDFLTRSPAFEGAMALEWENPYRDYFATVTNKTEKCGEWMKTIPLMRMYNVTGHRYVEPNDDDAWERAIMDRGPVAVAMDVPDAFVSYEAGVFHDPSGHCEGRNGTMTPAHAVNLVGWGYDAAVKEHYWILRNSWSGGWGENGYARMKRSFPEETCGEMAMPMNYSNIVDYGWGNRKACGMCGILVYGVQPEINGET